MVWQRRMTGNCAAHTSEHNPEFRLHGHKELIAPHFFCGVSVNELGGAALRIGGREIHLALRIRQLAQQLLRMRPSLERQHRCAQLISISIQRTTECSHINKIKVCHGSSVRCNAAVRHFTPAVLSLNLTLT